MAALGDDKERIRGLQHELTVQNNTITTLRNELKGKEITINVLSKELTVKSSLIDQYKDEILSLQQRLQEVKSTSESLNDTLRRKKSLNVQLSKQLDAPSTQLMYYCFELGITPNTGLLKSLHLDMCVSSNDSLSFDELQALLDVLAMKDSINTAHWKDYTGFNIKIDGDESYKIFSEIILQVPSLQSITLHDCSDAGLNCVLNTLGTVSYVSDLSFPNPTIADSTLEALFEICNNRCSHTVPVQQFPARHPMRLTELNLKNFVLQTQSFAFISSDVLNSLNLTNQKNLTDAALEGILSQCPALQSLDLTDCPQLTDSIHTSINMYGPNITTLSSAGCGQIRKISLQNVVCLKADWENILLLDCPKLTDIPNQIYRLSLLSFNCPSLQRIYLCALTLTDRELMLLGEGCPNVMHLSLEKCRAPSVARLLGRLRRLQSLQLSNVRIIKDADAAALPPSLTHLDLTNCYHLTDKGIANASFSCPALTALSIRGCTNITDEGIKFITDRCQRLTWIDVRECPKLTYSCLERLCNVLPIDTVVHETFSGRQARSGAESFPSIVPLAYASQPLVESLSPLRSPTKAFSPRPPFGVGLTPTSSSQFSPSRRSVQQSNF